MCNLVSTDIFLSVDQDNDIFKFIFLFEIFNKNKFDP